MIDLDSEAFEEWAFIQAVHLDRLFNIQGIWDAKDAQITLRQGTRIYYWYKIEVLDFGTIYNHLVKRGSGDEN